MLVGFIEQSIFFLTRKICILEENCVSLQSEKKHES